MTDPLKHTRDLNELRQRYGIVDANWAEAAELEARIRMGVTIDDASHLTPPVPVPVAGWTWSQAAVGGQYSGVRLRIRSRGGAYILTATSSLGPVIRVTTVVGGVWTSTGTVTPGLRGGDLRDIASELDTGSRTVMPDGFSFAGFGGHTPCFPMWFAQGTVLFMLHVTAPALASGDLVIQEVP